MNNHPYAMPTPITSRDDWRLRDVCRGSETPDDWFPSGPSGNRTPEVRRAIRACLDCPVRFECLRHAIDTSDKWGIRGGATPEQRREMASGQRKTA